MICNLVLSHFYCWPMTSLDITQPLTISSKKVGRGEKHRLLCSILSQKPPFIVQSSLTLPIPAPLLSTNGPKPRRKRQQEGETRPCVSPPSGGRATCQDFKHLYYCHSGPHSCLIVFLSHLSIRDMGTFLCFFISQPIVFTGCFLPCDL